MSNFHASYVFLPAHLSTLLLEEWLFLLDGGGGGRGDWSSTQDIETSSPCSQSLTPQPLCRQSAMDVSDPVQLTPSNQIVPLPGPYLLNNMWPFRLRHTASINQAINYFFIKRHWEKQCRYTKQQCKCRKMSVDITVQHSDEEITLQEAVFSFRQH